MPFGLANGPSFFQTYINDVLHGMLDVFCTAYIDDILIYSNSKKEHWEHVRSVLEALRETGLQADIKKCKIHVTEVNYLGLVITCNGIRMDPQKVSAVQEWNTPTCVRDVQAFIGFSNFYRQFIHGFSVTDRILTNQLTNHSTILRANLAYSTSHTLATH